MNTPPERDDSLRKDIEAAFDARSEDANFERALGRFIIAFADAEAELYKVLAVIAAQNGCVSQRERVLSSDGRHRRHQFSKA